MIRSRRRIPIGYRKYKLKPKLSMKLLLFIIILVVIGLYGGYVNGAEGSKFHGTVVAVSDGDTIRVKLDNGQELKVRLLGIDTPETHHPTKPVGCYGPEASNFTKKMLSEKEVDLEYDVERYDKYGRTLAYVYLNGERYNDILVKNGYAKSLTILPNKKYSFKLLQLELEAEKNKVGLWGVC